MTKISKRTAQKIAKIRKKVSGIPRSLRMKKNTRIADKQRRKPKKSAEEATEVSKQKKADELPKKMRLRTKEDRWWEEGYVGREIILDFIATNV
jgi:hypothetical protein